MTTIILNDGPYGTERAYNGLRLAMAMAKVSSPVQVFLMADAAACAVKNQNTPNGFYNIERMIKSLLRGGAHVYA